VKHIFALALALALAATLTACSSEPGVTQVTTSCDTSTATAAPRATPSISVTFPCGTITANIASTAVQRDTGLMGVMPLGANSGMLFSYADTSTEGYWMYNTPTALSIAYIDSTKQVINIDDMAPETQTGHYATRPYRYALEVNQGWFTTHGVVPGTVVSFTLPSGTISDP